MPTMLIVLTFVLLELRLSPPLRSTHFLILQPLAIAVVKQSIVGGIEPWLKRVAASLVAFSGAISVMASQRVCFFETT